MRGVLAHLVPFCLLSSSLVASIPRSSFQNRADSTFLGCLDSAGLDPVVQGDSVYTADAAPFNYRLPWKPAAIVYPTTAQGVAAAIKCGAANGVKVNARSGGHSYAAFALGGEDGHLTVDLNNLRHLSINGDTATIGAGNRLGDVALFLWDNGKRAMAHGTCQDVGIGGHAGQGGFGLTSRMWGLLADQVLSIEIVIANGSILTASQSENSDLFWAATGAGASFGVITSFTTVTHEALDSIAFTYAFENYGAVNASKGLQAWQKFSNNAEKPLDPNLGLQLLVNTGSGVVFSVTGVYYTTDVAKLNSTMAPLLEELSTPTTTFIQEQDWLTSLLYLAGVTSVSDLNTTLTSDYHDYFYASSTFVSQQEPLEAPATDALMQYFYGPGSTSKVEWFVIFDLYGGGKSAVTSLPADYNSFNGRDALYSLQYYGTIPSTISNADGIEFIQGMKAAIETNQPHTVFKEYVNYIDSTYSAQVAHAKYYPSHTERLMELKNKYDPERVIHFPQDF